MKYNIEQTIDKLEKICKKLVDYYIEKEGQINAEILEYDQHILELREFVNEYYELDDSYMHLLGID